jgi:hypothetical protein
MNQAPKTIVPSCIAGKPRQGEPRQRALDVRRWAPDYSHLTPKRNSSPSPLTPVLSFLSPPRSPSFGVLAAQTARKPLAKLGNMTKLTKLLWFVECAHKKTTRQMHAAGFVDFSIPYDELGSRRIVVVIQGQGHGNRRRDGTRGDDRMLGNPLASRRQGSATHLLAANDLIARDHV